MHRAGINFPDIVEFRELEMRRVQTAIAALAVLVTSVSANERPDQKFSRILSGVDGSRVHVSARAVSGPATTHVKVCAVSPSSRGEPSGFSVGNGKPIHVLPGETRCLSVAPASQVFVLWNLQSSQPPRRSISLRLDLTQSAGHALWFEWID